MVSSVSTSVLFPAVLFIFALKNPVAKLSHQIKKPHCPQTWEKVRKLFSKKRAFP
jgi:hypothetical protein